MSDLIKHYDKASNALRRARAINDVIGLATEEDRRQKSIHDAADAAGDYLEQVAQAVMGLYEAASKIERDEVTP